MNGGILVGFGLLKAFSSRGIKGGVFKRDYDLLTDQQYRHLAQGLRDTLMSSGPHKIYSAVAQFVGPDEAALICRKKGVASP